MSPRIKIIFASLIVVAAFLVGRVVLVTKNGLSGLARTNDSPRVLSATDEDPLSQDSDKDGVADYDEAYYETNPFDPDSDDDGFLDGEEVVSGYDPTEKTEKVITFNNTNTTQNLTEKIVAGIYAGDLNPRNGRNIQYAQGLELVADSILDEAYAVLSPSLDESTIREIDSSKESQEKYLESLAVLLERQFLTVFMEQPYKINKAIGFAIKGQSRETEKIFSELSGVYNETYDEILTIPVPSNWLSAHKQLSLALKRIAANYSALTKIDEDPFLALVALQDFQNNLLEFDFSISEEFKKIIQKEKLKIPDSPLFRFLNIDLVNGE